ncbi:MAG: hypothetical protein RL266_2338 [Bacteroidota bacterium]|jgi:hypothetical protein
MKTLRAKVVGCHGATVGRKHIRTFTLFNEA